MNISELNDTQLKAILYDLMKEYDKVRQSISALEQELQKRSGIQESPAPKNTSESDEDVSESDEDVSEEEEAEASSSED